MIRVEPLVSIIVPVYNVELYLKECLESILRQTYSNIEIILVDDGSTDKSGEICDKVKESDTRVIVLHKKNGGLSSARNYGLKESIGEYVLFVDSDDVLPLDSVQSFLNCAQRYNVSIVIGKLKKFWKDKEEQENTNLPKQGHVSRDEMWKMMFSLEEWKNTGVDGGYIPIKFFQKKIIGNLKFNENKELCEDELFIAELLNKVKMGAVTNKVVYFYRQRKSSIVNSSSFLLKLLKARVCILRICCNETQRVDTLVAICHSIDFIKSRWNSDLDDNGKIYIINFVRTNYKQIYSIYRQGKLHFKILKTITLIKYLGMQFDVYVKFREFGIYKRGQKDDAYFK